MKKISIYISLLLFVLSCDDLINEAEKTDYGSLTLSFVQPSDELKTSLSNSRISSQLADVDQVRITLSGEAPTIVDIVNGTASYSRSGLPVGTISVRVDLVGGGVNKYTQNNSVTIIANQNATASFNAFAVTNQSISFISSLNSTYDIGDEISLSWTNTHADQPVDIERWDFIGSTWVKTETLAEDWVGNSGVWTTQGESSGESVKVRIQSTISNSFADSATFQLLGEEDNTFFIEYRHNGQPTFFNDVMTLNDGNVVASGRYGSVSDRHALLVKFDINDGTVLGTVALSDQSEYRKMTLGHNGEILVTGYKIGGNTQIILGAYNHNLSEISVVSPTNNSGDSKGAYSIDTYSFNGVDYILTAGEFETNGTTYPGLFMFDSNYNYLTTWYYNDAAGKFLTVKVINDTHIWIVGDDGVIDGGQQFGKNAAELTIFDQLTDTNLNIIRDRSAWGGSRKTVNIEGTVPSIFSPTNEPGSANYYYAGGYYYDMPAIGALSESYQKQWYDFVLDDNENEAVFVGNMGVCDADGDGVIEETDGICAEISIKKSDQGSNVGFSVRKYFISQNTSRSAYASWAKFNAIDKIDSGYVVAGSNLITTFNDDYTGTKGLIAVVNYDGDLRTVDDRSLLGRNIGMNDISNVESIKQLYPSQAIKSK